MSKTKEIVVREVTVSKRKKTDIVRQANKLISARYRLAALQQKIIHYIIREIKPEDKDLYTFRLNISELAKDLNTTNGRIYRDIKEATRELQKIVMVIPEPDGDLQVSWLSSAKYYDSQGYVDLEISAKLKPYLLGLKSHFTYFNANATLFLTSGYSIRIYQLLKQYQKIGKRTFEVEDLKAILGIRPKEYKLYGHFKKRVILTAQQELKDNQYSDITFTFKELKDQRKVVAIEFIIFTKDIKQLTGPNGNGADLAGRETILSEELNNYGVAITRTIKRVLKDDPDQIERAIIFYLEEKNNGREKKNPAGFISDCITGKIPIPDHIKTRAEIDAAKQAAEKADKELQENIRLMNKLMDGFKKQYNEVATELLKKSDITLSSPEFIEWFKQTYSEYYYKLHYKGNKPKKPEYLERTLLDFVGQQLPDEIRNFKSYAAKYGYTVKPGDYPGQMFGYVFA